LSREASKKDGKNGSWMPPFQGLDFKGATDSKDYALSGLGSCKEKRVLGIAHFEGWGLEEKMGL